MENNQDIDNEEIVPISSNSLKNIIQIGQFSTEHSNKFESVNLNDLLVKMKSRRQITEFFQYCGIKIKYLNQAIILGISRAATLISPSQFSKERRRYIVT